MNKTDETLESTQDVEIAEKPEKRVYVGQSIAYLINRHMIITGEIPEHIKEHSLGKIIEELIVPVSEIAQARKDVMTQGTPLYAANRKLTEGAD